MLARLVGALIVIAIIALAVFWWLTEPSRIEAASLPAYTPNAEHGKLVFYAGGCPSCHTIAGQANRLELGGGRGLASPFGTFYTPNISPDPAHGIGSWNEAQFVTAMLRGVSPGNTHYFPAFPYTSYHNMRLEDVRDLFAFLKTLPAVPNENKPHDVPFPFNVRRGVGMWKLLYFDPSPWQPDPSKDEAWNRGAYLVNGPGHCAECHSPRDMFGGLVRGKRFSGGPDLEHPDKSVPNITQDPQAIGNWSEDDIYTALTTGDTPEFSNLSGSMREVVQNLRELPDADRHAIATSLKSLPAIPSSRQSAPTS
jgi:mono/diheme cytochrome c family protein